MRWEDLCSTVDALVLKTVAPAWDVKRASAGVITSKPVGYFYGPASGRVGILGPITPTEFALCKAAAARAVGADHVLKTLLTPYEAASGDWIKVAYSPSVRRTGEALNFFPGTYPGGIPNHPSPMASMLTSALVGGGLGYGMGWLGEKALPQGYGKNLKRTLAILGGLAGAAPGAAWAVANRKSGHGVMDPWPLGDNKRPSDSLGDAKMDNFSTHDDPTMPDKKPMLSGIHPHEVREAPEDASRYYPQLKLGSMYTNAVEAFLKKANLGDFGGDFVTPQAPTPYDVNINHLGQTLWQAGASTPLMGATMGTMYAASQMPDPERREGWATGNQLGQLAMNAGKDYLSGLALGALVNTAVGTPYSASTFGLGNAALGLVRAGVKSLFGG